MDPAAVPRDVGTSSAPSTYGEAVYEALLVGPQPLYEILDRFTPAETMNATNAVFRLHELGAIVWRRGAYALPARREAN